MALVPAEGRSSCSEPGSGDWAADWRSLAMLWGLPAAVMLVASLLEPKARAVIWTIMLLWMGAACLANARRCSRTHCQITGRFFLVMAAIVVAYSGGILVLGAHGWSILGAVTSVGAAGLWWASERFWGRYTV